MSGFWGKLFRRRQGDDPTLLSQKRSTLAISRAQAYARERGWVFTEQQEQVLSDTLQNLSQFGFHPGTPIDIAYVAYHCQSGLARFMAQPCRELLKLRGPELEPLFNRVLLPDVYAPGEEDAYVDLLWEAVSAAETSEYLSNVSATMDFSHTRRGTLSYTFAQRRVTHHIRLHLPHGDPDVVAEIAANISPAHFDLISDGESFYCWVRSRSTRDFLALLQEEE